MLLDKGLVLDVSVAGEMLAGGYATCADDTDLDLLDLLPSSSSAHLILPMGNARLS